MSNHHSARPHLATALLMLPWIFLYFPINANSVPNSRSHAPRQMPNAGDEANVECRIGYRQRILNHCRYPNTEQPCFPQNDSKSVQIAVERAAKMCCEEGTLCSVEDFEQLCCRTVECLEKCYGQSLLQHFRDRFQYFDILVRPHPREEE